MLQVVLAPEGLTFKAPAASQDLYCHAPLLNTDLRDSGLGHSPAGQPRPSHYFFRYAPAQGLTDNAYPRPVHAQVKTHALKPSHK